MEALGAADVADDRVAGVDADSRDPEFHTLLDLPEPKGLAIAVPLARAVDRPLGVVLLGEALTLMQVSGIFLVVAALVGATLLKERPKQAKA